MERHCQVSVDKLVLTGGVIINVQCNKGDIKMPKCRWYSALPAGLEEGKGERRGKEEEKVRMEGHSVVADFNWYCPGIHQKQGTRGNNS